MKQYIFRHEKAFSMVLLIWHIFFQAVGFLLFYAVGMFEICRLTVRYLKIPLFLRTNQTAEYHFIACILELLLLVSGFADTETKTITPKHSAFYGLIFLYLLLYFYFRYFSLPFPLIICSCYFVFCSFLENIRKMFIEKVDRAKWEQRLRCLQCLRMIAENHNAAIER